MLLEGLELQYLHFPRLFHLDPSAQPSLDLLEVLGFRLDQLVLFFQQDLGYQAVLLVHKRLFSLCFPPCQSNLFHLKRQLFLRSPVLQYVQGSLLGLAILALRLSQLNQYHLEVLAHPNSTSRMAPSYE